MAIVAFPPVEEANDDGLLAIGGDLEPASLILAYSQGIFPWPISSSLPLAWFSPDPRGILEFNELHISKRLKRVLRQGKFEVRFNTDFPSVIVNCARSRNRKDGQFTWITEEIVDAYITFHYAGHAYSVETYHEGRLVGGLYGVHLGGVVSGESMFYDMSDASKVALITTMYWLHERGVDWIDTQMVTDVVGRLGGKEVPREVFQEKLFRSLNRRFRTLFPQGPVKIDWKKVFS